MFSRGPTQVTHIKLSLFFHSKRTYACQLPALMLPTHLLFSSVLYPLSLTRFNTHFGFLDYILVISTLGILLHNCC
ncbi:unnamed protein product [Hymenolepis diminuta]|uniref:Uncharacterized protein n=1 Tax=Hymenolepis diminuta TaxID=6216 RepID=A0A564Y7N5_HYMDI|nr:unnamed protein product [Hymenolepis diminuta]